MGRRSSHTNHWISCRRDSRGAVFFTCVSQWDTYITGSRLRYPRSRETWYSAAYDMAKVRRFATKYGCDIPRETDGARVIQEYHADTFLVRDGGYLIARNLCKADAEQVAASYRFPISLDKVSGIR